MILQSSHWAWNSLLTQRELASLAPSKPVWVSESAELINYLRRGLSLFWAHKSAFIYAAEKTRFPNSREAHNSCTVLLMRSLLMTQTWRALQSQIRKTAFIEFHAKKRFARKTICDKHRWMCLFVNESLNVVFNGMNEAWSLTKKSSNRPIFFIFEIKRSENGICFRKAQILILYV